jgi:hypothetical protein
MANQIQATIYQIDGNPQSAPITVNFLTSELVIREAAIDTIPAVQSAILYYNVVNNQQSVQTHYAGEDVATLVALANSGETSHTQATVLEINGDPQAPGGVQYSFPSAAILIGQSINPTTGVNAFIQYKGIRYFTSQTQATLYNNSNAGGGGGIIVVGSGANSSVRCGVGNLASGDYSTSFGGCNAALGNYTTIGGGQCNSSGTPNVPWSITSSTYSGIYADTFSGYFPVSCWAANGSSVAINGDFSSCSAYLPATLNAVLYNTGTYSCYESGAGVLGCNISSITYDAISDTTTFCFTGNLSPTSFTALGNGYGVVVGGKCNTTSGNYGVVLNGIANVSGNCFTTANGTSNIVCTSNSHILSGQMNVIACDAIPNVSSGVNSGSGGYYNGFVSGQTTLAGCFGDLTSYYSVGSTISSLYAYGDPQLIYTNLIVCGSSFNAGTCETTICVDPSINTCSGYIIKTGPFTTQSSYHPNVIAGGAFNTINGYTNASTISGGYNNTVSGGYSIIGGGSYHEILDSDASGIFSGYCNRILYVGGSGFIGSGRMNLICGTPGPISPTRYGVIVGGIQNSLSGSYDFIGNGSCNTSSSNFGFIGGGFGNVLSGSYTFIGGGKSNTSSACYSFTGSGFYNTNQGNFGVISGGQSNTISSYGYSAVIGGGATNTASSTGSVVVGGAINTSSAPYAFVGNGRCNTSSGSYTFTGSGSYNITSENYAFIGGGKCNTASGRYSNIVGGFGNSLIGCCTRFSTISGGYANNINNTIAFGSLGSVVVGGVGNNTTGGTWSGCFFSVYPTPITNVGKMSFIGGGLLNSVSGNYSAILGGVGNVNSCACSFIVGACITADRTCATFVNNLSIMNVPTSSAGLPSKSVWLDTAAGNVLKMVP